ncbi:tRNA pseudouridine synthase Pus10-like [Oppia nitens]|uniref:tRNA pseudouridine synthase Pus10-like n=1 Tax=Oppia nitens TaxID=1686743 RepID=UPI0023D9CFA1|nr:tRNA pseudouridine synthase Pus10-like [Oppia nitens]
MANNNNSGNATTTATDDDTDISTGQHKSPPISQLLSTDSRRSCASCLGLLDDRYCNQLVDKVVDHLTGADFGHQYKQFQLFVSLPVSVTLRHELLIQKLRHYRQLIDGGGGHQKPPKLPKLDIGGDGGNNCWEPASAAGIYSVKDIFRVILVDGIERRLPGRPFDPNSVFSISLDIGHVDSDRECSEFYERTPKSFFPKKCLKSTTKSFLNQSSILRALATLDADVLFKWPLVANTDSTDCSLESIRVASNPIYIAGRYQKYSRHLSQTPWILDDGSRLMDDSVQDIIDRGVRQHVVCDELRFSASGREDVDVRMLGRGRPFILEVVNPRTIELSGQQFLQITETINMAENTSVTVRDLQLVSKSGLQLLKDGENAKTKTYRALCCMSRPLSDNDLALLAATEPFTINQKTPIRVLHRRTLSVRPKKIYKLGAERVTSDSLLTTTDDKELTDKFGPHLDSIFYLYLTTEAGTYVKEFVHSDFGRTVPSLATLLGNCRTDIIQLDVMEINTDWPPIVTTDDDNEVDNDMKIS